LAKTPQDGRNGYNYQFYYQFKYRILRGKPLTVIPENP
jgi:hypothetical protein